jgi:hypothetical protein
LTVTASVLLPARCVMPPMKAVVALPCETTG